MTDEFAWWRAALAGNRGPISADEPQPGFYRQKRKDGAFEPVAYWKDSGSGEMRCHVNGKSPQDPLRMMEIWPYASLNPISEDAYWHRMDTGQWQDNDAAAAAVAQGPDIDPATDPVGSMRAEIEKAKAGLPQYSSIESDEQAARAQTLRSALTGLAGKAEKARKAEKDPHFQAAKAVDAKWQPLIQDAEKASHSIRLALGVWEDIKRANQRRAEQETARQQQEANKEAEWQGAAPGAIAEPPAPVAPVKSQTPPPAAQIKGASGRAASVTVKKIVTAIDIDKAFAHFRESPELYAFLLDLSQKAIAAGITVDGATVEERSDVR